MGNTDRKSPEHADERPSEPAGDRSSAPAGKGLPAYAELDCLSNFTFLTGASHPEELVRTAAELGYRAIALADDCSLAGVVRAWREARRHGLHLIIGSRFRPRGQAFELIILARDHDGHGALSRLITRARLRSPKGQYHFTLEDLWTTAEPAPEPAPEPAVRNPAVQEAAASATASAQPQHTVPLPGCLLILKPDYDAPAACLPALEQLQPAFRGRLWLGLYLPQGDHDARHRHALTGWAGTLDLPLVALGGVQMHRRSRQPLHDTLCAIRTGRPIVRCGTELRPNAEHALRSRLRLANLYPAQALAQTLVIARQCIFSLDTLRYQYPEANVPPGVAASQYLRDECLAGAARRYPGGLTPSARRQLDDELSLVCELGYEAYFLTVYDLVRHARRQGILCQGRGSAANSMICYCLGITEVDPIARDLLFARFISRERGEPPDIDVDFEHQRREEIIQYVYDTYGRDHAALTAVVITYRRRSALRDTGKALGIAPDRVEQAARTLRHTSDPAVMRDTLQALCPEQGSLWATLASELTGFPRHLSQHPGGFVIARQRLDALVPLENAAMPGRSVIQWDKDDLDTMGLLKVDILALGILSALRECARWVLWRRRRPWALADIPWDDPDTFAMIRKADTVGVFQIESRAQMSMLPRLQPRCFHDLVIQVAIVRPGPMQGGMVHPYLRRRQGLEAADYPSPAIRQILERTLGIPIFQEQAMRLSMVAAGFSAGEADQLRRSMAAWRRTGEIAAFHDRLRAGMAQNGYSADFAESLIRQLDGFGEYGFPESHAASFARLAWISAWLKCHEPEAFLVALLNAQPMGFYAPSQLVQDARRHGVVILPVDVRHSQAGATLEYPVESPSTPPWHAAPPGALADPGKPAARPAVRLGLQQVRGLSHTAMQAIVACRDSAPIRSIQDLAARAGLDAGAMRALAAANAFAGLAAHRGEAHWQAALPRPPGLLRTAPLAEGPPPDLPSPDEGENLVADYAALGLTLGRHPLALLRQELARRGFRTAAELTGQYPDRRLARGCGLVTTRQRPHTAHGTVFITLEDETGPLNVILHAREADRQHATLVGARLMGVYGIWQRQQGVCHLIGRRLVDLSPLLGQLSTHSRDFH